MFSLIAGSSVDLCVGFIESAQGWGGPGTQATGGGDGPVEILCLPHRQAGDYGRVGHATERHLQFIAASRYSKRLHVVVEDLRDEIMLPDNKPALSAEGVLLGLKLR